MTHGPLWKIVEKSTAIFVVVGLAIATPALAASGGGGGGGGSGAGKLTCKKGYVEKNGTCQKAELLEDKELYEKGRALAVAGNYENALGVLEAIRNKDDSMVLTMIGYSKRKLGHVDEGMSYYRKALALNPDNVNTREYLGEAFVEKGRTDLALVELASIEKVCGTTCEQYEDLAATIAGTPEGWQ